MEQKKDSRSKVNIKEKGGKKIRNARRACADAAVNSVPLQEAVELIKKFSYTKFDATLDIAVKLGIDAKRSDQNVRGVVLMPAGNGKKVKVAVICKEEKFIEAQGAGADIVGRADLIADIKNGKIDFDVCIATPDIMPEISVLAKILGPKGLMPNPKLGTITTDVALAVKNAKAGRVQYRNDKGAIVHAGVGKLSFTTPDLVSNILALIDAVVKAKPSGTKGNYLKSIYLSATMAPSVKVDLASISQL